MVKNSGTEAGESELGGREGSDAERQLRRRSAATGFNRKAGADPQPVTAATHSDRPAPAPRAAAAALNPRKAAACKAGHTLTFTVAL